MKPIICKICSNGCKLSATQKDSRFTIDGNKCEKGFKLLQSKLRKKYPDALIEEYCDSSVKPSMLKKICAKWDLSFEKELPNISIQGSPERSLFRTIIEDSQGEQYLLEEIEKKSENRREKTAKRLQILSENGVPTIVYLKGKKKYVQKVKGRYWMCQKFLRNVPLKRGSYWRDAYRGDMIAHFLLSLESGASGFTKAKDDSFKLKEYIKKLVKEVKKRDGETHKALKPVYDLLKEHLFPIYGQLEERFSHGDPHPLNMIWSEEKLEAVIDWEFSGFKPKLYDVSLILGCVGSEDEAALDGPLVKQFIKTIHEANYLTTFEWQVLPLFTIAQRFAWLSEWLRRKDSEMVDFELFYMRHLLTWKPVVTF